MRQSLCTALLILLAAGVMAMGAPLDDAKKSNTAADKKLIAAGAELNVLAKSFARHLAALADVAKQLEGQRDRQKRVAPLIAKALESANADLVAAKTEASAAQRSLRDAEANADRAKQDLGPKRAAVERAAADERKAFENSDVFKDASAQVGATDAAYARERARLDAATSSDPSIAPLTAALTKAEEALAAARSKTPADDAAIAEASARWIDAKNRLSAARAERYAKDEAFSKAQSDAARAAAARSTLSDAFDKSILGRPGVAEAQLALRDAIANQKLADAAVANAREALERAGRWLIIRRANADAIAGINRESDDALAGAAADLRRAQDAARDIGLGLAQAVAHVLAIRDDVKATSDAVAVAEKTK